MKKTKNRFMTPLRVTRMIFALLAIYCSSLGNMAIAQESRNYSGIISDESGLSIPNVTILLKGQNKGTISDADGRFQLNAKEGDIIIVSFIGYENQELTLTSNTDLNIILVPDMESLREVVVVGYGTLDKKEVTSAITHLSSADLLQTGATNPMMSIQGQVAGLTITNTGGSDPNSGPSIQLRGATSRMAGSSPLVVVNGLPGGNLENINANDIESIDVLKDGAASAIYGTQGSNGVIMITTKSGKSGSMQATYNGYASFNVPINELEPLSAQDFLKAERGTDYGAVNNWHDAMMRSFSFTQSHTLSFSGGSENSTYRASVDYRDAEGLDIRSGREEYGARVSLKHVNKTNRYELALNVAPRIIKRNNSNYDAFTKGLILNPTYPVMDPDNPALYTDIPAGSDGHFNPVEMLALEQSGSEVKLLDWNATFKLNIIKGLSTQATVAQNVNDYFDYWFRPASSSLARRNNYAGEASRAYNKYDQKNFDWLLNFNKQLVNHSIKAMAGYSYQYNVSSGLNAENKDFTSDALTYNNLGDGTFMSEEEGRTGFGTWKEDSKLISFFGRINYAYNNKYLATISVRREGSSKFGFNNKWGTFPAASIGWRISEEDFMQNILWVDDLKVRADYGVTGNQAFGNYMALSIYGGFGEYYYNGEYYKVWGPGNNTNADLKWEKGHNMNIGLDFSLANYWVNGSINYYRRRQEDILGNYRAPIPPNVHAFTTVNVGTMENNGLELDLDIQAVKAGHFQYNLGIIASSNDNKFVSFSNQTYSGQPYEDQAYMPGPGTPGPAQRLEEGKRIGQFYMWKFAGVDQFGNMLVYNKEGDIIQQNEATIDDKQEVGNGLPKYHLNLNHMFKYKNWDLSVYMRGVFGYDIFNVHDFYYGLQSSPMNENVLPSAYGKNKMIQGDKVLCDYFLEKGDYLKFDVATLGYTFKPNNQIFQSVRVFATAKNFATITGFSGVDPETYPINGLNPGITTSKAYYPSTATYLVGLQVKF